MSLTVAIAQRLTEKRVGLVDRYFEALRKCDPSNAANIDEIDELASALGRNPEQVDQDRAAVLAIEAAAGIETRIEKLCGDVNAANAEFGRFEAWRDSARESLDAEIDARRVKVQATLDGAAGRLASAKQTKRDAANARRAVEALRSGDEVEIQ